MCGKSKFILAPRPRPALYAGFVSFVATLNRASLRRQFSLFGWIHMSLLLIVVSSHFIVNNILEVRAPFLSFCTCVGRPHGTDPSLRSA